jgi:hypothetical protein
MAARGHILGLHTKDERQHAYGLVSHMYRFAMLKEASAHDVHYSLGYVEAVLDLLKKEAPDDEELVGRIVDMRDALLEKSAIPFSG